MIKSKKIRLIFIAAAVILIILAGYVFIQPRTKIQNELSQRSLDYLSKSKGELENVNLKPQEKRINERIVVTDCFTFIFPFDLTTSREQEKCNWIYNFSDPIGRVVIRLRNIDIESLDDLPDVKLRILKDDEYIYKKENINGVEYYIFEKVEDSYEISSFAIINKKVLSISLTSQINRQLNEEFRKMIETIETY